MGAKVSEEKRHSSVSPEQCVIYRSNCHWHFPTQATYIQCPNHANLKSRQSPGLLIFSDNQPTSKETDTHPSKKRPVAENEFIEDLTCWARTKYVAAKFSQQTTFHGVDRAFDPLAKKKERMLWCLALIAALYLLLYVCLILAERYNRKQLQTIIDTTKFPVYEIPFPELTICNRNRLNWSRLPAAKQQFLQAEHRNNKEQEELFTRIIAQFDTLSFGQFHKFNFLSENSTQLQNLNYINMTSVVDFMSWRCDEMLQDCVWNSQQYNCCEIFFPRHSQLGSCLAFNSLESHEGKSKQRADALWPWRIGIYGPGSGLIVKVLTHEQNHSPLSVNDKGITYMTTKPRVWFNAPIDVAQNTKTSVSINTIKRIYGSDTRTVPIDQRECIFDDEFARKPSDFLNLKNYNYSFENCLAECQQQYLVKLCNCTMDLMYPSSTYPPCKLTNLPCLARHNHRLIFFEKPGEREFVQSNITGMECKCYPNCYSLEYVNDLRATVLEAGERIGNSSYTEMDFYFRRSFILVYKTNLRYTWVDLLAAFHGIATLVLCFSLISIIEILFYCLFDVPKVMCKLGIRQQTLTQQRVQLRSRNVRGLARRRERIRREDKVEIFLTGGNDS